jgi:hypothetical protein
LRLLLRLNSNAARVIPPRTKPPLPELSRKE